MVHRGREVGEAAVAGYFWEPDAAKRKTARPGWQGGRHTRMRYLIANELGHNLY